MNASLDRLPVWDKDGALHVVIETPRNARAKFTFDPVLGAFLLTKPLMHGLTYPYDWGFIPGTKAPDGDPLDAIVIHEATTYPGTVIKCRVLGVLEVSQTEKGKSLRNDRIIATPAQDPRFQRLGDFTEAMCKDLQEFFLATHALENVDLKFLGWKPPGIARRTIKATSLQS